MLQAALVLIDVQQAFDDPAWGARNNPEAEANVARLLAAWRAAAAPVVHVRHKSTSGDGGSGRFQTGTPAFDYKPEARPLPGEHEFVKSVNNAFVGTELESLLRRLGTDAVVMAGLTTDHCVSTTARMAADLGFRTTVVSDATATHDRGEFPADVMHRTALASLAGEFAAIVSTAEAVAQT